MCICEEVAVQIEYARLAFGRKQCECEIEFEYIPKCCVRWFPSLSLVEVNSTAVSPCELVNSANKIQSVNDEKEKNKTNKNKNDDDVADDEEEEEQRTREKSVSVYVFCCCCCCWFKFRCVLKYSNGFRQCVNLKGLVAI